VNSEPSNAVPLH